MIVWMRAPPSARWVFAVQLSQAAHLRVSLDIQVARRQRIPHVPYALRPVEIGLQVQPQVALNDGADLQRRELRRQ
jgi:hypothetical protein